MTFHQDWLRALNVRIAQRLRRAVVIGDSLFGIMSLFLFFGLVAIVVLWVLQKPSFQLTQTPTESVFANSGESVVIDKGLSFETDTGKAYYQMWLEDSRGNKVYQYPTVQLDNPPVISFAGKRIDIPAFIAAGDYKLMVFVKYDLNPVKTAETTLEIAQVRVFANPSRDARF